MAFSDGNVSRAISFGVYICQPIRFAKAYGQIDQNQNHLFTRANDCKDWSLDLTNDVNLVTGSSELSAEEIIAAGSAFQSLMVSGKKLYL